MDSIDCLLAIQLPQSDSDSDSKSSSTLSTTSNDDDDDEGIDTEDNVNNEDDQVLQCRVRILACHRGLDLGYICRVEGKGSTAVRNSLTVMRTHMPYGIRITRCYLTTDRGEISAFTSAN